MGLGWLRFLFYLLLYVLIGPPIVYDCELNLRKGGAKPFFKAILGQWKAFYGDSEYDYEVKLTIAQASTVAAAVLFGTAATFLVADTPTDAKDWGWVQNFAVLLAVASAIQVMPAAHISVVYVFFTSGALQMIYDCIV